MDVIPLALVLPLLILTAVSDLRGLKIPNALSVIALALFALTAPLLPLPEIGIRLLAALCVFAVGFLLFALRTVGGGDVKILSVLMLFIPADTLVLFGYVFPASLLAAILLLGAGRAVLPPAPALRGFNARGKLPMAVAIALAGAAHLLLIAMPQIGAA